LWQVLLSLPPRRICSSDGGKSFPLSTPLSPRCPPSPPSHQQSPSLHPPQISNPPWSKSLPHRPCTRERPPPSLPLLVVTVWYSRSCLNSYVCGPPFRELSESEDVDTDLVMGESVESLLNKVCFFLNSRLFRCTRMPGCFAARACLFLGRFTFPGQFVGPLDQRRSSKGEKLLMSTTDWRKQCSAIPQWPAPSYEQWKLDNAAPRPPHRRDQCHTFRFKTLNP